MPRRRPNSSDRLKKAQLSFYPEPEDYERLKALSEATGVPQQVYLRMGLDFVLSACYPSPKASMAARDNWLAGIRSSGSCDAGGEPLSVLHASTKYIVERTQKRIQQIEAWQRSMFAARLRHPPGVRRLDTAARKRLAKRRADRLWLCNAVNDGGGSVAASLSLEH